jgi:ABC-type polysaccharide/polyol phosphate export permease
VTTAAHERTLRLDSRPAPLRAWLDDLWRYRAVTVQLAKKDFRVRYKRATFGILWALLMPLLQSLVLIFVFSRVGRFGAGGHHSYAAFVLAGMAPWIYISATVGVATTSIVDGSGLTDKVWFPRATLALVPILSNLVTLLISVVILLVVLPVVGQHVNADILLLVPAAALAVAFATGLGLVLAAGYVYFRDIKFMVQAVILVWFYVTPIVYPESSLGSSGSWLDLNPLTGIVVLFQRAAVGPQGTQPQAIAVSVGVTLALLAVGVGVHRRHDRLFVDLL